MDKKLNAEWELQIQCFKSGEPIDWEKLKKIERETKNIVITRNEATKQSYE